MQPPQHARAPRQVSRQAPTAASGDVLSDAGRPPAADRPPLTRREARERVLATARPTRRRRPAAAVAVAVGALVLLAPVAGPALVDAGATGLDAGPVEAAAAQQAAEDRETRRLADAAAAHRERAGVEAAADAAAQEALGQRLAAAGAMTDRVSRSERAVLPDCPGAVSAQATAVNGEVPAGDLCALWDGQEQLRADAAVALAELDVAYRERFGTRLEVNDGYRSLAGQHAVARTRPGFAAAPGTSDHGWGLAVDLGGGVSAAGEEYRWLRENAPAFGWDNPAWARPGGSGPTEPWHWELVEEVAALEAE